MVDEAEEYIDFMAKYKDWISIKRIGIRPDTKPEEVAYYLAGIRSTIDSKAYSFLGIKTSVIDEFIGRITNGKRKSYGALSEVVNSINSPDAKAALADACGEHKDQIPLAEIYLLGKAISSIGFDISLNQGAMSKVFPDLKPPKKPPGGRKKKE
jgi:hypothetical protein